MFIRITLFAGLAVMALSGSAFANCYPDHCPPPKCVGAKCYVVSPLPSEKKDFKPAPQNLTPSIPIPPPRERG
jgi:hypothetical protein